MDQDLSEDEAIQWFSENDQLPVEEAIPETKDTRSPEEIALDELPLEDLQVDDEDDPEFSPYVQLATPDLQSLPRHCSETSTILW